ncbi:MAG: Bug family tripartite tricarboxylate transporter substrate binding protein [Candidatus Binatia bacterium]
MIKRNLYLLTLVVVVTLVAGASTAALGGEFYKGKTIRFIVGFSPGGGYDTYTRFVARHIGKYIPGNPTPIVQNMTGAGSLIAGNYIYNRAKPDGLTVGIWNSAMVLRQALGDRGVKIDARKINWIGTPSVGMPSCGVMGFTGLRTLKDVLKSKEPIKMGSTRAGSTTNDLPKILNKALGTNFNVIAGYRGTATIRIAMQKREVDGACWGWESMRVTARSMLDAKGDDKFIPFLTHGNPQDPEVKDLPQLTEIMKGESLAIVKAWLQQYNFQRPFSLPPGTPKDRVNILRKAFKAALNDPELLAEAKKSKLIITYVSGEKIEKYVDQILSMSPKTKESLEFLVIKKKKKR